MAKRKRDSQRQTNANVVAVVHRFGRRWLTVIAHVQGVRPRLLAAEEIAADQPGKLNALLDEHAPAEVICVLPASSIICRTVNLPDVPSDQLQNVLNLQAEAHLSGIAPSHRMSMAVLPEGVGEDRRSGLVLAWPESTDPLLPGIDRPMRFTGDVAGMAGLIAAQRPDEPMIVIDRENGSIGVAMPQQNGIRFRAACEDSKDSAIWSQMVIRTLAETALNAGHSDSYIESMTEQVQAQLAQFMADGPSTERANDAAVIIPAGLMNSLTTRVQGAKLENDWWKKFGIAIGVVLVRHGEMAPLLSILREPKQERPSRIAQAAHALSQPRTAVMAVAVCLVLAAILPTLLTGLRMTALRVRHSDLTMRLAEVNQLEKQVTMYRLLSEQAWPMSKLLADLAACTPRGIDLEVIRMEQGQVVSVSGRATPSGGKTALELISEMQENLLASRIFHSPTTNAKEGPRMTQSYDFDLTVRINDPHRLNSYDVLQNYALYPMQDRVDGKPAPDVGTARIPDDATVAAGDPEADRDLESATSTGAGSDTLTSTTTNPPADTLAGTGNQNDRTATVPGRTDVDNDPRRATEPRRTPASGTGIAPGTATADQRAESPDAAPRTMPELLTEDQISQMDRNQVMASLSAVAEARQWFRDDAEATEKLDAQFRLLMNRLREVPPQ